MAKLLGPHQLAEGMRSGKKMLAKDLVQDGRNPGIWDSPEWVDPPHPQERPYVPDDVEGKARYKIAPENLMFTAPVLTAVAGVFVDLTWTVADFGPSVPAELYTIYRAVNDGPFVILDEIPVEYTEFGALITVNAFTDEDVTVGSTYSYKVVAANGLNGVVTSNIEVVDFTVSGVFRITEDEAFRLTEDGAYRILE